MPRPKYKKNEKTAVEKIEDAFWELLETTRYSCITVAQVVKPPKRTILNLGGAYPSEHIAIVIWAPELPQFEKQFGNLYAAKGKRACANGRVVVYKHHLQVAPKTTDKLTIR